MSHSPGPWTITDDLIFSKGNDLPIAFISDGDGVFWGSPLENKKAIANGKLIAAAPELLSVAKAFCEEHTQNCGCNNCAVIAKAEGKNV